MFSFDPDQQGANVILPLGHDRPDHLRLVLRAARHGRWMEVDEQTIAYSDQIHQEDIALCVQVQRGLRSRSDDSCGFSAMSEIGPPHSQQLVPHG
jgi:hypothetical protein